MRKTLKSFLILVSFLSTCSFAFAAEIPAQSKITKAVVYPDSALLIRQAVLSLDAGVHTIVFADIIPSIDENSLRVSGEGSAKAKVLGAQLKREYLEEKPSERIQAIEKELQKLSDEKKALSDGLQVVYIERSFLSSLKYHSDKQLPRDLVTKMPTAKDVGDILSFLAASLKTNYASEQDLNSGIRDIDKKIEALRNQLDEVSATTEMKTAVTVDVEAAKAGNLTLEISYRVMGVSWQPFYEARADFEKSATELVAYGLLRQATGEDWNDVDVVLSTARPGIGGRMPDVEPYFLKFFQPRPRHKFGSAAKTLGRAEAPMALDMMVAGSAATQEFAMEAVEEKEALGISYAAAQSAGVSVTYTIPRKATIKADGSDVRLPIFAQSLATQFKYAAFPKASDFSYLAAHPSNTADLELPAGRMNVFSGQDYVGVSSIEHIGPGETFDLFLGVDENVKVKRQELERKTDDVLLGNIPSPTRKITVKYKITVENYKNKKIDFELFEAMPVSQDERIKVRIDQVTSEPKNKDYKDKPGVWRWEFVLEPQKKKEIAYTVTIEYPRNMQVEGL